MSTAAHDEGPHPFRLFTVAFDNAVVAGDRTLCEPGLAAQELSDRVVAVGVVPPRVTRPE